MFYSYASYAENIPAVLFLTQAITSAVEHNPELQRLRTHAEITQAEARSSSTVQNPYFTFDADPVENEYRFGLQKAFETGGAPKWAGRASLKRAEIDQAKLEIETIELKSRVTNAYTDVYINQERITVFKEIYDFLKEEVEEGKNISLVDKLLVKEELIALEHRQENAKVEIEKAHLILESMTGENLIEGKKLQNPRQTKLKENLDSETLIKTALAKRPEILESTKEIELAEILRKLALANRYPLVILEIGSEVVTAGDPNERGGDVFISADIELPILGIEKKELQTANLRLEQVKKEREGLENDIRLNVTHAFTRYKYAKQHVETYEKKYLSEIALLTTEIRKQYEAGGLSIKDLLRAEKAHIEIQNNYFESLYDYEQAASTLERAVGISLVEENSGYTPSMTPSAPQKRTPERLEMRLF